jgi:hypothetical protein
VQVRYNAKANVSGHLPDYAVPDGLLDEYFFT